MTTITISRATVEQALEALERARPLKADYTTLEYFEEAKRKHYAAMADLRATLAQQAEPVGTRALIEECLAAFAQELAAWDIDPPLHHVKQAHDKCEAWLAAPPQQAEPLTVERLRDALVASRIIPPAAVEDPDEYDDGVTLYRIEALHRRIT